MNTYQLECFLSLASSLSFAKTAEQLNTSQPAITRQLQSLESELGTLLFNRTTRNVSLTVDGKAFIGDARSIVEISSRAIRKFDRANASEILPYAIGCSGMAHMSMLIPVIRALKQDFPAFHPSLVNLPLSRIITCLVDGTVDIALGARLDNKSFKNCSYREILKSRLACIFAGTHPLAGDSAKNKKDITADELQQYLSVLYNPIDIPTPVVKQQRLITGERPSSELYFCDSAEEALVLISAGIGAAIVPEILIPKHLDNIQYRFIEGVPEVSFGVYYRSGRLSQLSRRLISLLTESLI